MANAIAIKPSVDNDTLIATLKALAADLAGLGSDVRDAFVTKAAEFIKTANPSWELYSTYLAVDSDDPFVAVPANAAWILAKVEFAVDPKNTTLQRALKYGALKSLRSIVSVATTEADFTEAKAAAKAVKRVQDLAVVKADPHSAFRKAREGIDQGIKDILDAGLSSVTKDELEALKRYIDLRLS